MQVERIIYSRIIIQDVSNILSMYLELINQIKNETADPYFRFEEIHTNNLEEDLKQSIENQERCIYKAQYRDEIIGFIAGEIKDCFLPMSNIKKVGYISAAYIKQPYRKKGIMKQLENKLMEYFSKEGLKYVELHVLSKNRVAKKSWGKMGYHTFRESMRKSIAEDK